MFNEFVILHTPPKIEPQNDKNTLSVEKMTQTGEGGIWQVSIYIHIFFMHSLNLTIDGDGRSDLKI